VPETAMAVARTTPCGVIIEDMASEKKKKQRKQAKLKRKYAYERDDVKGQRRGVIIFLHRGEVGPNVNIIFESNGYN